MSRLGRRPGAFWSTKQNGQWLLQRLMPSNVGSKKPRPMSCVLVLAHGHATGLALALHLHRDRFAALWNW